MNSKYIHNTPYKVLGREVSNILYFSTQLILFSPLENMGVFDDKYYF